MNYPKYPQPISRITSSPIRAKDSMEEQYEHYNFLKKLGFAVIAKQRNGKIPTEGWKTAKLSPEYQLDLQERESASGWIVLTGARSKRLLVVDIDPAELLRSGQSPQELYEKLQGMSETSFVLATPANGVHLYYRIPEEYALLPNYTPMTGLDTRGEGGLVVSLGGYNFYAGEYATHKGVEDGHEAPYAKLPDGCYDSVPLMSEEMYNFLRKPDKTETQGKIFGSDEMVNNYANTEKGNARLEKHFKQDLASRESVVIECLDVIFKSWGKEMSNDEWLQVWVSAHHGAPTIKVRDFILGHNKLHWSDGDFGKQTFASRWVNHVWQEDGFSVASLFWIARKAGWLASTGYEIPDSATTKITTRYITDWSKKQKELPKTVLLMSQTGTGKTQHLPYMWERLGKPKSVIFVPTVKLATELAFSLQRKDVPATLYLDEDTHKAIDVSEMKKAKVLVTTLQTFATKLYTSGITMSQYGLVYIEEIDQLLAGFAKGGGGLYTSHVSENEAKLGFQVLRDAYSYSEYVWGVDATMSQLSLALANDMAKAGVTVLKNTFVHDKAPVTFLKNKASAYNVILRSLMKNKSVVAICDTMSKAHEVQEVMENIGVLKGKKSIVVTSSTAHNPDVTAFMRDVNTEAGKYDLVAYNSVMGSGVSVDQFTPDVIVQVGGYLTPRNNLQMLNRYRTQAEVYCYYRIGESVYGKRSEELLKDFENRVDVESKLIRIPLSARSNNAELRAFLASTSVSDDMMQNRSPKEFYISLLNADGREVDDGIESINGLLTYSLEEVRELKKERWAFIQANWRKVRPISNLQPADPTMTSIEVAMGEHHGQIDKALQGNIPTNVEDEYISNVVVNIAQHGFLLSELMIQDSTLSRAERYMLDSDKAISAIHNNVSSIKLVSLLNLLYGTMDTKLTPELLAKNHIAFVNAVQDNKDVYDAVVVRGREKFDMQYDPNDLPSTAIALAKIMLRVVGLKQASERFDRKEGVERRAYSIGNLAMASAYLTWRNINNEDFKLDYSFSTKKIDNKIGMRQEASVVYRDLDSLAQTEVMQLVTKEHITFQEAVEQVVAEIAGAPII